MQGELIPGTPHGPCIICFVTKLYNSFCVLVFCISAEMIWLMPSGFGYLLEGCKNIRMCACGKPLF
jgi:hypothetical protein